MIQQVLGDELPPFSEIPDKWKAKVVTQCGNCGQEHDDILVELETNRQENCSTGMWVCAKCKSANKLAFDTKLSRQVWASVFKDQELLNMNGNPTFNSKNKAARLGCVCCVISCCACGALVMKTMGIEPEE
eukprot:TRINITY_DN19350_c1_g2_i2.p1 TRINITY_DN19350_c1_g2~~TRINITY_DN19350_c1_g2_i2.p1  ORF type:complete len:131 (+),score=24.42 TRINITY_DN19350_c1_g2_i2:120-512(+)